MPTKTACRDYNELLPDKPRRQEHVAKGARPCCAALEKMKREIGVKTTYKSIHL